MAANPTNPQTADTERVKTAIESWKRKLLDLTKRNRALNFKVSKVSTITIVDEKPAEVFRNLYIQERSMRFAAAPETDNPESSLQAVVSRTVSDAALALPGMSSDNATWVETNEEFEELDEDDSLHTDFVPYEPSTLEDRHI